MVEVPSLLLDPPRLKVKGPVAGVKGGAEAGEESREGDLHLGAPVLDGQIDPGRDPSPMPGNVSTPEIPADKAWWTRGDPLDQTRADGFDPVNNQRGYSAGLDASSGRTGVDARRRMWARWGAGGGEGGAGWRCRGWTTWSPFSCSWEVHPEHSGRRPSGDC